MTRFAHFMLTAGGLGHMPIASGTWGSMPPVALVLALVWLLGLNGLSGTDTWTINGVLIAIGVAFSWACVRYGVEAEQRWGRKDPGQVVADEVAGQCVTLLALPWRAADLMWNVAIGACAFFAFRLFDIVKPPPANGLQRLRSGWGILVDDLIAGLYAVILTQLVVRLVLVRVL